MEVAVLENALSVYTKTELAQSLGLNHCIP